MSWIDEPKPLFPYPTPANVLLNHFGRATQVSPYKNSVKSAGTFQQANPSLSNDEPLMHADFQKTQIVEAGESTNGYIQTSSGLGRLYSGLARNAVRRQPVQ